MDEVANALKKEDSGLKKIAYDLLDYNTLAQCFTAGEIAKSVLEVLSPAMQDREAFSELADEKGVEKVTLEDAIDFALNDFDFNSNFLYTLFDNANDKEIEKFEDNYEEKNVDVSEVVDTTLSKDSSVRKQLEADLNVTRSAYKHDEAGADEDGVKSVRNLLDNDDKVNEELKCNKLFEVDLGDRDNAFVYVDGQVLVGGKDESHSQILNRYLGNNNISKKRIRSLDTVEGIDSKEPAAFGHISENIAFIQVVENCSEQEVVNALKENNYKKIYFYNYENAELVRLAMKRLGAQELSNIEELIEKENCKDSVIKIIAENIDMVFDGTSHLEELKKKL